MKTKLIIIWTLAALCVLAGVGVQYEGYRSTMAAERSAKETDVKLDDVNRSARAMEAKMDDANRSAKAMEVKMDNIGTQLKSIAMTGRDPRVKKLYQYVTGASDSVSIGDQVVPKVIRK
jgi:hypothetical protein